METNILSTRIKKLGPYLGVLLGGILIGMIAFGGRGGGEPLRSAAEATKGTWTCSMHPQVHQEGAGSCPLCGMDLVQSADQDRVPEGNEFRMSEESIALANIATTVVSTENAATMTISLSGIITPNERTNSVLTTLFDGRIEELEVNTIGEYVQKGQQIGRIYSPEMYAAQDQLLTSASYKNTHQKLFNAARNNLGLWKLTDEQINELLSSGKPMKYFPLYADVSGTVTEIFAAEGNFYNQGDPLFKLSRLQTVWAVFDVYENQLSALKVGQKLTIRTNAVKNKEWNGTVDFIEPILNANKRTVSLRATLANNDGLLKPGMFVSGEVRVQSPNEILTIPRSAVLWTGKRSLVYLRKQAAPPVFEMTEVVLGESLDEDYEVLEGLSPGDEVVINGTFTLDAAAQLQRKKSMMGMTPAMAEPPAYKENALQGTHTGHTDFTGILATYMKLKDALVASDDGAVRQVAMELTGDLQAVDDTGLHPHQQQPFRLLRTYADQLHKASGIDEQRTHFKPFSAQMTEFITNAGALEQKVYVQFCPMADNHKGATWLSLDPAIRNPYFGDRMLSCGSIKATLE